MTDLVDQSARHLRSMIDAGDVSCVEVAAAYLDQVDAKNPEINAIVARRSRDEVLADAQVADEVPVPERGALHGLVMAPKDLTDVAGLTTTYGSPLFANNVAASDGLVAHRLRRAGAVFIGKTNTPEMGLGSHTFNEVYGATLNPTDVTRSAGGSSGGAAAALAANMLPIADGSDMMGSLRNPAAWCGVYGMRPSWGLVPNSGPGDRFIATLATEGPMARNLGDLALLLDVLAGPIPQTPFAIAPDAYQFAVDHPRVESARVGWLGDWGGAYPCEAGIIERCETALGEIAAAGHAVETVPPPFDAALIWDSWRTLRSALVASNQAAFYADGSSRDKMKPELIWEIEAGLGTTARELMAASQIRTNWYAAAADLFAEYDLLVMPTAQFWPIPVDWRYPTEIAGVPADTYHRWMEVVVPVSLIGLPSLSVPIDRGPTGLPMGMQLIGPTGGDAKVLSIAATVERWRSTPI